MKKAKALIFATLAQTALYADPLIPQTPFQKKLDLEPVEDELVAIDRVISLTERQLDAQKKLKKLIAEIHRNKEMFMKADPPKLYANYLVRASKEAYLMIKEYHLEHLFSSDFLEDLALFNTFGSLP